jgi:benzoate membrane transport protein
MSLERPALSFPSAAEAVASLDRHIIVNGMVAFLFAATGPLVILIAVGRGGGLSPDDISSWVFGAYGFGGVISIVLSLIYRMPLALAWTIPGTVLLIPAFDHLSFAEIIGAYLVSGVAMAVLGVSGLVGRVMERIPLPVVMGMVAGVFLPFGLNIVSAFGAEFTVALVTTAVFVALTLVPTLARVFPPVLGALVAGFAVIVLDGRFEVSALSEEVLARPILYTPEFTFRALAELVVPLMLTVIAIQNVQGTTILRAAGYDPPVNTLTFACGVGSLAFAIVGSVPTCVTGPANAILNGAGKLEHRWVGGVSFGVFMVLFGLFSPLVLSFALALPAAFILLLGGLAMLRVLQSAFAAAFGQGFSLGALVAFIVTVSDVTILNVGAAFWALVFGFATAWLFERQDFAGKDR